MTPAQYAVGAEAFTDAAQRVVDYLNGHTPISDWSVSRVADGVQVHLHVHHEDLVDVGARIDWSDSLCRRMVDGAGHVVPDTTLHPDFAESPLSPTVRAYAGFPITDADGSMFGILCGVDLEPLADADAVDADLVSVMSDLLSTNLRLARVADEERRSAQVASALADTDVLTGLMNRRGWDALVADAQHRVRAFGDPVTIAMIDLDGLKTINDADGHRAGDRTIRRAADALREAAGPHDHVARYGGDEFAVLSNGLASADVDDHYERFVLALADHGVAASLGAARCGPEESLSDTFDRADDRMYSAKKLRRYAS